jgi:hypothetical protein
MRNRRGIFLTAAMLLGVASCRGQDASEGNEAAPTPVANASANLVEALPLPEPALGRAGFLEAIAAAASAHTARIDDSDAQAALDGRRFSIRIRFGCGDPAPASANATLGWTPAKDSKSFEVRARPDLSLESPSLQSLSDETIEAVEGFWIPRPWLRTDACPAPRPEAEAPGDSAPGAAEPAPPPAVARQAGLAQYFTADDSRVGRRSGRPYVATETVQSPEELPRNGLILVLEGRLEAWPDGKVIRCTGSGRDRPPACIASALLDRAAFLQPGDDAVIAEWRD